MACNRSGEGVRKRSRRAVRADLSHVSFRTPVPDLSPAIAHSLRRRALVLVWAGESWNILEMAVALWSGFAASSVALIAFGLDSIIELFAGAVLIRHLSREWKGSENVGRERKALRLVGVTFYS